MFRMIKHLQCYERIRALDEEIWLELYSFCATFLVQPVVTFKLLGIWKMIFMTDFITYRVIVDVSLIHKVAAILIYTSLTGA